MNNASIDAMIDDLVASVVAGTDGKNTDDDLVREIIVTGLKLIKDKTDRGDVKMMNTALKELRYSFLVFNPHRDRRKVAVYGSARTGPDSPNYQMAEEFGRRFAEDHGWMVITGAGPGIMEAANKGAGTEASFGVNIRLPFENGANDYLSPGKVINFKYFFTRKVQFVKESDAFALFPGGFGTMDEAFELLTLVQTGKSDMHPIVMIDHEGTGYWDAWDGLCDALLEQGMISAPDRNLYLVTTDLDEAIEEINTFFRVYHSQRFVDRRLVLRLNVDVPDGLVAELNEDFDDIISSGKINKIDATQAEIDTGDNVELPRLAFDFDRHGYGRLRALIDRLNDSAA
ncbi:MAG: TIGR00730 family Rossman fold protein [Acidimicrobiia bacterium]|nr:MAG: TIGR00730 family Rossman fold protein [Acidimicrobiia bacterium]